MKKSNRKAATVSGSQQVIGMDFSDRKSRLAILQGDTLRFDEVRNTRDALITRNIRKSDTRAAETLARLTKADPTLLSPIHHRGPEAQQTHALIRVRDRFVQARREKPCGRHGHGATECLIPGTRYLIPGHRPRF